MWPLSALRRRQRRRRPPRGWVDPRPWRASGAPQHICCAKAGMSRHHTPGCLHRHRLPQLRRPLRRCATTLQGLQTLAVLAAQRLSYAGLACTVCCCLDCLQQSDRRTSNLAAEAAQRQGSDLPQREDGWPNL